MTLQEYNHKAALLSVLIEQTPTWLRNQLTSPDPVWLHDWNLTKTQYEAAVRDALRMTA
jgi:hypothetical protein